MIILVGVGGGGSNFNWVWRKEEHSSTMIHIQNCEKGQRRTYRLMRPRETSYRSTCLKSWISFWKTRLKIRFLNHVRFFSPQIKLQKVHHHRYNMKTTFFYYVFVLMLLWISLSLPKMPNTSSAFAFLLHYIKWCKSDSLKQTCYHSIRFFGECGEKSRSIPKQLDRFLNDIFGRNFMPNLF